MGRKLDKSELDVLPGTKEEAREVGSKYYFTGKPWASRANVRLPQGGQNIYLEPLGSRRLSSQNMFDLRISKIFRFGNAGRFEILADVLNLLNSTAEQDIASRNAFSASLGVGDTWVDPRRVIIGVKLAY